jgi:hypothetical protein
VRGTVYPQRCDLSPDGRWLCYFTLRGSADWSACMTYVAVSRLPWATALAAWGTDGTWTRGLLFVAARDHGVGPPDAGDPWDERRAPRVTMEKARPGGGPTLRVNGEYAAFRTSTSSGTASRSTGWTATSCWGSGERTGPPRGGDALVSGGDQSGTGAKVGRRSGRVHLTTAARQEAVRSARPSAAPGPVVRPLGR